MFAFRPARSLGLSWRDGDNAPLHLVSPSSLLQLRTISDQWPVFLFVDFKVTCCLFSYVGVHTRRQHTGTWIGCPNVCMCICERARACMLAERPLSCIVMHVDKAIRRHVLRMLHARVGLCTWHRTDRWTPCRFHFPPSKHWVARGAPAGLSVPLFFSGFLPLFSGASGFRVAVFLRSFRYSRAVLLLPRAPSLSLRVLSVSIRLSLSSPLATSIETSSSLLPLLFTLVFSLLKPLFSSPLALFFLAFAFVFCQPPFAALRVRFV